MFVGADICYHENGNFLCCWLCHFLFQTWWLALVPNNCGWDLQAHLGLWLARERTDAREPPAPESAIHSRSWTILMLCMRLRSCEPLLAHTEALGADVELWRTCWFLLLFQLSGSHCWILLISTVATAALTVAAFGAGASDLASGAPAFMHGQTVATSVVNSGQPNTWPWACPSQPLALLLHVVAVRQEPYLPFGFKSGLWLLLRTSFLALELGKAICVFPSLSALELPSPLATLALPLPSPLSLGLGLWGLNAWPADNSLASSLRSQLRIYHTTNQSHDRTWESSRASLTRSMKRCMTRQYPRRLNNHVNFVLSLGCCDGGVEFKPAQPFSTHSKMISAPLHL